MIRETPSGKLIGHDGVMTGYQSTMGWFPEHRVAAAFQVNQPGRPAVKEPMHRLLVEFARIVAAEIERGD